VSGSKRVADASGSSRARHHKRINEVPQPLPFDGTKIASFFDLLPGCFLRVIALRTHWLPLHPQRDSFTQRPQQNGYTKEDLAAMTGGFPIAKVHEPRAMAGV